jgi:hypothetical protein
MKVYSCRGDHCAWFRNVKTGKPCSHVQAWRDITLLLSALLQESRVSLGGQPCAVTYHVLETLVEQVLSRILL